MSIAEWGVVGRGAELDGQSVGLELANTANVRGLPYGS
jgi:hypothetical protein